MPSESELRAGEIRVAEPTATDAGLVFIGRIHTPWRERAECPRQGALDGPVCTIEVFEPWTAALAGVSQYKSLDVLYWLHRSRRDLVLQSPANDGVTRGTFSIRSPVRPNPIGVSTVALVDIDGARIRVRGLDCLDGTPLLDLKPDKREFKLPAPPGPAER